METTINTAPDLASLRQQLADDRNNQDLRFRAGDDVAQLVADRSAAVDTVLVRLWRQVAWPDDSASLVAVGGYGRGELFPWSDIDLLVLTAGVESDTQRSAIETFLTSIWDLGLEVGHSVRSIEECARQAGNDLTVVTSMMEARTLVGDDQLRKAMQAATAPDVMWGSEDFYRAKLDEQAQRHRQYNNTEYNLEPNVKGGPGGLRDVQILNWIALREYDTADLHALVQRGFMSDLELGLLEESQRFLWQVRWGLHTLAGRREDRLLFEYQRDLAALFGYEDRAGKLAVEQFMHDYYRHVLSLRELNDLLLQHFDEAIVRTPDDEITTVLNPRFSVRAGYIMVNDDSVLENQPSALMELFVLMGKHAELKGVRASTIRRVREHLYLIDDNFRHDPVVTGMFMELLRSPHKLVSQLTRMRRYGVLGRYLPEFGQVVGQMQHDLFHIYTVDAHTMLVLRNMRRFFRADQQERFPVANHCVNALPKVELLYVAGLYHDIGKGRGGDHSELGAVDAEAFCQRHGLGPDDTELVIWLVRKHLLMSSVAQRKDISDPDVIQEFAAEVRSEERLNYLYALTCADINATNPTLWNSWRAALMRQLYNETRKALRRGLHQQPDREQFIEDTTALALARLAEKGITREQALAIWDGPDDGYFLRQNHNDIVWQTEAISQHNLADGPLVEVRDRIGHFSDSDGGTMVFVHAHDQPGIFAAVVAALGQLNLSVQDARIHTSNGNLCFDTFVVLDDDGRALGNDPWRIAEIRSLLTRALQDPDNQPKPSRSRVPRKLRHFAIPTKARVTTSDGVSHLQVEAADRPGLLARLALVLVEHGISVHSARITTLGERVEDHFTISTGNHSPLTDPAAVATLCDAICTRLDEGLDALPSR